MYMHGQMKVAVMEHTAVADPGIRSGGGGHRRGCGRGVGRSRRRSRPGEGAGGGHPSRPARGCGGAL